MPKYWATADQRTVRVYQDGLVVGYRRGDFSGKSQASVYQPPNGRTPVRPVEVDEVDAAVEEMGFVAGSSTSWKWVEDQGYYRFPVVPEARWKDRQPPPPPDLTYEQLVRTFGTPEHYAKVTFPARSGKAGKLPQSPGRYRDEVEALRRQGW